MPGCGRDLGLDLTFLAVGVARTSATRSHAARRASAVSGLYRFRNGDQEALVPMHAPWQSRNDGAGAVTSMFKLVKAFGLVGGCLLSTGCTTHDGAAVPSGVIESAATSAASSVSAATPDDVRLVPLEHAPLVLGVSNQSFDDPAVQLTLTVDGVDAVAESFAVEGQHTVTHYGFDLVPGRHTLKVVSDTGASASESFEIPAEDRRWIYVDYWYFDPAKEGVTWGGNATPGPALVLRISDKEVPMA